MDYVLEAWVLNEVNAKILSLNPSCNGLCVGGESVPKHSIKNSLS